MVNYYLPIKSYGIVAYTFKLMYDNLSRGPFSTAVYCPNYPPVLVERIAGALKHPRLETDPTLSIIYFCFFFLRLTYLFLLFIMTGEEKMLEMFNLLLLCVTISFCVGVSREDRYHQPGDITLGGLFMLHYTTEDGKCGEFFPIGLGHVEAMIFAVDKINKNPDLLPNITLGYDIRDYCESAPKSMEHTYDFVRRNEIAAEFQTASCPCADKENITKDEPTSIAAVIGPADSGSAVLVASLFQVAGIPVISHSATSIELSFPQYRDFFRTAPPDGQQAKAMADIIQHFSWSYVAAVAMDDSYGRNGMWKLESEAGRRKTFCIAFAEYIPRQEYGKKLTIAVNKLKSYPNIRVVVLWLFGSYGRRFLKEASQQKLFNHTWILSEALTTEDDVFVGLKTEDQRILHGSLGIQPRYLDNGDLQEFLIKESRPFRTDRLPWWRNFWKSRDKINCSLIVNGNKRKKCMEIVFRTIYDTYIPFVEDAVFAVAHAIHNMKNCFASRCQNPGNVRSVINPKELRKYLRRVDFNGLTGRVSFDRFGDPVTSSYDIVHFQVKDLQNHPIKLVIGSWEKGRERNLQLNVTKIKWNAMTSRELAPRSFCSEDCPTGTYMSLTTSCCWECPKCPAGTISTRVNDGNCTECPEGQKPSGDRSRCLDLPEIKVMWSSLASVLVILFASIGVIFVVICSFILYKHRETPIVKAANRELSSFLMVTIVMSFSMAITSLANPTNFTCGLVHCWRSMVLVTFISILMLKTMKILSVFEINVIAERFKKFILATKRQTLIVLALISIPGVLLFLWIALDPPRQERIIQPAEGAILSSCSLHHRYVGMALQIAISVYTFLFAVVCTFYAFKARSLPENFNEARYIGFSLYILLLSSVGYLPIDIGLKGSYATYLACAMTLLSSYGILICMFGPKIYVILRQPEQNTHESVTSQVSNYSFRIFGKGKIAVQPVRSTVTSNQNNLQLEFASTSDSKN